MAGSAYVYLTHDSGHTWTQQQQLLASSGTPSDQLGVSVAVQNETIVVGAYRHDNDQGIMTHECFIGVINVVVKFRIRLRVHKRRRAVERAASFVCL